MKTELNLTKTDSNECWTVLREVIGNNSHLNDSHCVFNINEIEVTGKQILCSEFSW